MNILNRLPLNNIEGISILELKNILLKQSENVSIKYIIYNDIFLSNSITIKCVNNYYKTNEGKKFKTCNNMSHCIKCQNFFNIKLNQNYSCETCHLLMAEKLENDEVKLNK